MTNKIKTNLTNEWQAINVLVNNFDQNITYFIQNISNSNILFTDIETLPNETSPYSILKQDNVLKYKKGIGTLYLKNDNTKQISNVSIWDNQ